MSDSRAPGWRSDPTGEHELRYHDGTSWTHHVSTDGERAIGAMEGAATTAPPDGAARLAQHMGSGAAPASAVTSPSASRKPWLAAAAAAVVVVVGILLFVGRGDDSDENVASGTGDTTGQADASTQSTDAPVDDDQPAAEAVTDQGAGGNDPVLATVDTVEEVQDETVASGADDPDASQDGGESVATSDSDDNDTAAEADSPGPDAAGDTPAEPEATTASEIVPTSTPVPTADEEAEDPPDGQESDDPDPEPGPGSPVRQVGIGSLDVTGSLAAGELAVYQVDFEVGTPFRFRLEPTSAASDLVLGLGVTEDAALTAITDFRETVSETQFFGDVFVDSSDQALLDTLFFGYTFAEPDAVTLETILDTVDIGLGGEIEADWALAVHGGAYWFYIYDFEGVPGEFRLVVESLEPADLASDADLEQIGFGLFYEDEEFYLG